jgi:glycosyltransferase involved in cell wall biosynthesis
MSSKKNRTKRTTPQAALPVTEAVSVQAVAAPLLTAARSGESARVKTLRPAPEAARKKRVLVVSHNHPQFFPGGAEIIAYDLFNAYKRDGEFEPYFMAGTSNHDRQVHTGTPFQTLNDHPDEIIFWGDSFDYFLQSLHIKPFLYSDFRDFLLQLQPDVIHFHHTMRIGIEALHVARQTLPNVKIVYTLHEYIFICNRDGQMVRKHNNELCGEASPARCHQCFPEISPAEFKIRESFLKAHLDLVDMFVSPSHFLIQRFVDWGIPRAKMRMVENGRDPVAPAPFRTLPKNGSRNVFGYFGQINPFKGAMLTFQAAKYLVKQGFEDFRLEVFGNVEQQSEEFKKEFYEFLDEYREFVGFHGKYKNSEMGKLIQSVDWVILPSTWWENSPLVIQEVFMHKRPILCSDIGGMAEKVENEVTGLHFQARNDIALAKTMRRAVEEKGLWEQLSGAIGPRLSIEGCADKHKQLYHALLNGEQVAEVL